MLAAPGAEASDLDPFPYRDDPVLMPGQRPVGRRGLVEQDGAHRPGRRAQTLSRKPADRAIDVKHWPEAFDPEKPDAGDIPRLIRQQALQLGQPSRAQS